MLDSQAVANRAGGYNPYFDYIRAISALSVVLYHYTTRYDMLFGHLEDYPLYFKRGCYGVLVFFILSGYFTFKKYAHLNRKIFMIGRFFRLYPLYWASLAVTMIMVSLFLPERGVSLKEFLVNITMFQGFLGIRNVDAAYWTLYCELFFYFMIVLASMTKLGRNAVYLILVVFGGMVFISLLSLNAHPVILLLKKITDSLYIHCFMIGGILSVLEDMLFQRFSNNEKLQNCRMKVMTQYVFLIVALTFFCSQQYTAHEVTSGNFLLVATVVCFISIVIFRLFGGGKNFISRLLRPLAWLSAISYPVYLLHQNIGYIIIKGMEKVGMTSEFALIIPVAVIILIAYVLNKIVGDPAINFGKAYMKKRQ